MTGHDDGGPAFPNRGVNSHGPSNYDGMTLRDWFAGQALIGELAAANMATSEALARCSYGMADAMLAERNRRNEK